MPNGTILLVDDNPTNLEILLFALGEYGYQVKTVKDGLQALQTAQQISPDLILLDVMMPGLDGYQVCQQLKADPYLKDVPVVFVSALSDTVDKLKGFSVGGVDYLTKPLEFEEVLARANAHVALFHQRKEIERLLAERERAETAERQQRLMLNIVLETAIAMNNTLKLPEVLTQMLTSVRNLVEHDAALVILLEAETGWIAGSLGLKLTVPSRPFPIEEIELIKQITQTLTTIIIGECVTDPRWLQVPELEMARSCLIVPIISEYRVIGLLGLLSQQVHFYSEAEAQQLQSLTIHAAIAIKNARLYEQAQELAVIEERQRLARDLHDSVTQTLYAAHSIAEVLPRIIDTKPDKGREYLHELAGLTGSAMAEMRSLLVELRSEALTQTDLSVLVKQLCEAFTGRAGIPVSLELNSVLLPANAQVVFYRTVQEALNNIIKHARATQVQLHLTRLGTQVELRIKDNGRGFEVDKVPANHFGVQIMRERAATIGAALTIKTQQGYGTEIILRGNYS